MHYIKQSLCEWPRATPARLTSGGLPARTGLITARAGTRGFLPTAGLSLCPRGGRRNTLALQCSGRAQLGARLQSGTSRGMAKGTIRSPSWSQYLWAGPCLDLALVYYLHQVMAPRKAWQKKSRGHRKEGWRTWSGVETRSFGQPCLFLRVNFLYPSTMSRIRPPGLRTAR